MIIDQSLFDEFILIFRACFSLVLIILFLSASYIIDCLIDKYKRKK